MTEQEWLDCADPKALLDFMNGKVSVRKLQLFAVGCCERIWDFLTDGRSRNAINTLRRFADGRAGEAEMEDAILEARGAAGAAVHSVWVALLGRDTADRAARTMGGVYSVGLEKAREIEAAVFADVAVNAHRAVESAAASVWGTRPQHVPTTHYVLWAAIPAARAVGEGTERIAQRSLIDDIFANPFRPVSADPTWLTSTVTALAEGIYTYRAFDRLPILADALQDAGCDSADVLNHCRSDGPHVRGCWVVDLLLRKQ